VATVRPRSSDADPQLDPNQEESMIATKTAQLPQGTVAYREFGEGDPLVFVHGLLVDGRLWDGVVPLLSDRFRCLVPDWPLGSHRTPMNAEADLSPPGTAEVIVSFLDALGIERATIVGNDTGGAVSQMLTAAHPDRVERLILTNCDTFEHFPPFPFNGMPILARLPGGLSAMQAPMRFAAVRRMSFAPLAKKKIDPVLVDSWLEPASTDREIKRDLTKILRGIDKRQTIEAAEKLRTFERPVRFAWATEDRFFKVSHAERLAKNVPDARIVRIPDARTFVPLDQPQRTAELIAEFVTEGVPSRA
jgi:pimeloyl-ACP methyl ester carboxylesterase